MRLGRNPCPLSPLVVISYKRQRKRESPRFILFALPPHVPYILPSLFLSAHSTRYIRVRSLLAITPAQLQIAIPRHPPTATKRSVALMPVYIHMNTYIQYICISVYTHVQVQRWKRRVAERRVYRRTIISCVGVGSSCACVEKLAELAITERVMQLRGMPAFSYNHIVFTVITSKPFSRYLLSDDIILVSSDAKITRPFNAYYLHDIRIATRPTLAVQVAIRSFAI